MTSRPFGILSRSERRSMERAKEKHIRQLVSGGYRPFEDITDTQQTREVFAEMQRQNFSELPIAVHTNGLFIVQTYATPNAWGALRVMIRWADSRPEHDWALFQRIKNDIFGADRVALEVYPAESNKQDVANMYWLWVLPAGFECPIEIKRKRRST